MGFLKKKKPRNIKKQIWFYRRVRQIYEKVILVTKISVFAVFIGLCVFSYYNFKDYFSREKLSNQFFSAFSAAGLQLKDVYIEGQQNTSNKQIIRALGAKIGDPIMTMSLNKIRNRLENIGWIKHAVVDRQLPSTLYIGVVERTPIALGQRNNRLFLIDEDGQTIRGAKFEDFTHLPIIIASDPGAHAKFLISMLKKDLNLFKKIYAMIRVSERRWNIRFDNKLEILLPEKKQESAWQQVIELNKHNELFKPKIKSIDLRVPNKIFFEEL